MKKILAVGAYERDNFGDILFFMVLKKYFPDDMVVASGLGAAEMTDLFDEKVLPYTALARASSWDVVWVVGGEIGGANIEAGVSMLLSGSSSEEAYRQLDSITNGIVTKLYVGDPDFLTVAYVPRLSKIPKTTKLVINSVGVSGAQQLPIAVRDKLISSFKGAVGFSVRDEASVNFCARHKVNVNLAPDVVHTIRKKFGNLLRPKGLAKRYVAVQLSHAYYQSIDKKVLAQELQSVSKESNASILFIAAGLANYHDDYNDYKDLQQLIESETNIFYERDPLLLSAAIANATAWIGTSLHGRIVAGAYAVPRISLDIPKVTEYARYWDPSQPFGVAYTDISSSVQSASLVTSQELAKVAGELESKADENMEYMMSRVA